MAFTFIQTRDSCSRRFECFRVTCSTSRSSRKAPSLQASIKSSTSEFRKRGNYDMAWTQRLCFVVSIKNVPSWNPETGTGGTTSFVSVGNIINLVLRDTFPKYEFQLVRAFSFLFFFLAGRLGFSQTRHLIKCLSGQLYLINKRKHKLPKHSKNQIVYTRVIFNSKDTWRLNSVDV